MDHGWRKGNFIITDRILYSDYNHQLMLGIVFPFDSIDLVRFIYTKYGPKIYKGYSMAQS